MDVKRKNGEYIGAFVPYGYEKSDDDKHKLVIDIYAAGIVKEIFRLKLHGMSQDAIATQLNNEGVLAPMEYKQSTGSGYQTGFLQNEKSVWSSVTVRRILENEIYIGNLVQGKRTTPNHKVKQEVVKPESDWIRIEKIMSRLLVTGILRLFKGCWEWIREYLRIQIWSIIFQVLQYVQTVVHQ